MLVVLNGPFVGDVPVSLAYSIRFTIVEKPVVYPPAK
jgi:hypothetical protein